MPGAGLRQISADVFDVAQVNPALEDAEYKNANGNNRANGNNQKVDLYSADTNKAGTANNTPATTGANKV